MKATSRNFRKPMPWVVASSSFHGFVAAVAIFLAFVPPEAYRRMLERRAGTVGA